MKAIIDIKVKCKKEDYKEFLTFGYLHKKPLKLPLYSLFVVGVIFILFTKDGVESKLIYLPIFLGIYTFYYGLIKFQIKSRTNKRYKTDVGKLMEAETSLKFYDKNILVKSDTLESSNKVPYETFYRAYNWRNLFILYINYTQAVIIPKDELSEEEVQVLDKIFMEKLDKKYILK